MSEFPSQIGLLSQVLLAVNEFPEEQRKQVWLAKAEIDGVVRKYGEMGAMGLAICGLEGAAAHENEEILQKMEDAAKRSAILDSTSEEWAKHDAEKARKGVVG